MRYRERRDMSAYIDIGHRIRQARERRGFTQAQVGQMFERKRSHAAVSDIERGLTKLDVDQLIGLAAVLGVTLDQLLHDRKEGAS